MEFSDGIDESVIILHCNYPDCLMEFDNRWSLTRHEMTHTGEKHFKCFTCSKRFVQKCSLTRHEHTHSDERPFPCTHSNCGKRFKLKEYLRTHMKTHKKAKEKKSEEEQVDEQG
jgi:KRAB domain-containing zinc finger protein